MKPVRFAATCHDKLLYSLYPFQGLFVFLNEQCSFEGGRGVQTAH